MDMRRAAFGSSERGAGGGGAPIEANLDRLQITDTIALTGFTGSFTTQNGLSGSFQGRVNGDTPVTGTIDPQGEGSALRVRSTDAGGVFRSAGLLRQAHGGSFDMTMVPAPGAGQYDGKLRVENTRIKDAPAIAALINAVSIVGLIDELAGQGIQFSEIDARFRLGPSRLTLYSASAVGPSIGISMDGLYDVVNGVLDMRGVVSPLYILNAFGAVVTRKGEGLFGFNYTLKGTATDPVVSVNPLSAIAPAMMRDIFRKPRLKAPDAEFAEDDPPKPKPKAVEAWDLR